MIKYNLIIQHLVSKHRDETKVRIALKTPIGSEDRAQKFARIVNKGSFMHNLKVMIMKSYYRACR